MDHEDLVDGLVHLRLLRADVLHRRAVSHEGAQRAGVLAQLVRNNVVHLAARVRALGLREGLLGHDAVLLHERAGHVPLPGVLVGIREKHNERIVRNVREMRENMREMREK